MRITAFMKCLTKGVRQAVTANGYATKLGYVTDANAPLRGQMLRKFTIGPQRAPTTDLPSGVRDASAKTPLFVEGGMKWTSDLPLGEHFARRFVRD